MQIPLGAISFEAATEILQFTSQIYDTPLIADRLESAWFVYKISSLQKRF